MYVTACEIFRLVLQTHLFSKAGGCFHASKFCHECTLYAKARLGREKNAKWLENPKESIYIYIDMTDVRTAHTVIIMARRKPHPKKKEGPDSRSMGQTLRCGNSERGSWGYPSPSRILEPWWR